MAAARQKRRERPSREALPKRGSVVASSHLCWRKSMDRRPPATKFLFVSKDTRSKALSHSEADVARSINRHAQRWAVDSLRKQKTEALRATCAPARRIVQLGWTWRDLESEGEAASDGIDERAISRNTVPQLHPRLFSANYCRGDSFDPFNTLPFHLDQETHSIVQFYMTYSILTASNPKVVATRLLRQRRSPSPLSPILHGCMHEDMHLTALLTATAARMNQFSNPPERSADTYMQPAIRSLRTYLQSCTEQSTIKPQTILDILFLAVAEWYRQDYAGALAHMHILQHLTRLLDLSERFDGYVFEMICDTDVFLCVETGSRPLFPITWETDHMSLYQEEIISRQLDQSLSRRHSWPRQSPERAVGAAGEAVIKGEPHFAQAFAEALKMGFFSADLHAIVSDLAHLMNTALLGYLPRKATEAGIVWVAKKSNTLLHRLLSPPRSVKLLAIEAHQREQCCRLAAIILLSYFASIAVAQRLARMNMLRLKEALSGIDLSWGSKVADKMLLWVLTTGLFAAQDLPEEEWFKSRAEHAAFELGVFDCWELHRLMRPYLQGVRGGT